MPDWEGKGFKRLRSWAVSRSGSGPDVEDVKRVLNALDAGNAIVNARGREIRRLSVRVAELEAIEQRQLWRIQNLENGRSVEQSMLRSAADVIERLEAELAVHRGTEAGCSSTAFRPLDSRGGHEFRCVRPEGHDG